MRAGRPKKLMNIDYNEVEKLGELGLTDTEVAYMLGIDRATLYRYKKDNQQFCDSLKKGKDKADAEVVRALYNKATGGDTTAMIFWLKNRRVKDWRDKQEVQHSGDMDINITIGD